MKKLLIASFIIIICGLPILAQSPNYSSSGLDSLANQLKRQTVNLSDRTSEDLRRNNSNSRSELEAAFLARQLDAGAGLFQQLVRDNRSASELRDAASILSDLVRRAPNSANRNLWQNARNAVNDINRELGGNNNDDRDNDDNNNGDSQVAGRAFWRGTVDKEVQLIIKNREIETRLISGSPYSDGNFSFTSPLPTRNMSVEVNKKKGRGDVRVIQQPNRNNNYTAIVQIYDEGGGAREYQLEIFWR